MRTELQWLLEKRCGEDVIDDEFGACFVCDLRDGSNVDNFERRIGWAFKEHDLGVRANSSFPVLNIGAVDDRDFDAIFRQDRLNDVATRAENGASGNHVIAGLHGTGSQLPLPPYRKRLHVLLRHLPARTCAFRTCQ